MNTLISVLAQADSISTCLISHVSCLFGLNSNLENRIPGPTEALVFHASKHVFKAFSGLAFFTTESPWMIWMSRLVIRPTAILSFSIQFRYRDFKQSLPGLNLTKLFYNSTFSSKRTWQLKSKMEKKINNWCLIDLAGIESDSLLEQAWNYVIQFKKEMTNFPISINNLDLRCTVNASIQKKV